MRILHVSTECYPAAKAGGLGDVAGALPKALNQLGVDTSVIIPKHRTSWMRRQQFAELSRGFVRLHNGLVPYVIEEYRGPSLGFPLMVVSSRGLFDREGVYTGTDGIGYGDEVERNLVFQQAVLKWIQDLPNQPALLHCHDHHTGLIPFMIAHCPEYKDLAHIPTVFTVHNGQYTGSFSWEKLYLLPFFDSYARGLLDWEDRINPLATGIRCSWRLTTVSPGYLEELRHDSNGMEWLFGSEWAKSQGILNGIDTQIWDPATDPMIDTPLGSDIAAFKAANKEALAHRFRLNSRLPLVAFIGRLVGEKGADLLPAAIPLFLREGGAAAFVILGTGNPWLEEEFRRMSHLYPGYVDASLEYNEALAHQLYAGADFLLMPSRVEPCGLNQMYAMRYGTVPVVRRVGGLKDTVPDVGDEDGRGLQFQQYSAHDIAVALMRATHLYKDAGSLAALRQRIMALDFSWSRSAARYLSLYRELTDL